jgi:hypothetical protein
MDSTTEKIDEEMQYPGFSVPAFAKKILHSETLWVLVVIGIIVGGLILLATLGPGIPEMKFTEGLPQWPT